MASSFMACLSDIVGAHENVTEGKRTSYHVIGTSVIVIVHSDIISLPELEDHQPHVL